MSSNTALVRHGKSSEWDQFVPLWLHGRPRSTQEVYEPVVRHFRLWIGEKPISKLGLKDLQDYADTLAGQKPRTVERKLATLKSLTAFCYKTGLIPFDVGRALRTPKIADDLVARIPTAPSIRRMIAAEPEPRNSVLLEVLYASGIRASEASGLDWKDTLARDKGEGQISVLGKGNKTRTILLPRGTWEALQTIRPKKTGGATPVFVTKTGRRLSRNHISIIVANAARRAGIDVRVSAHKLRHGHASHSLSNGASLEVIRQTLGHTNVATTSRYLHASPTESSSKYLGL